MISCGLSRPPELRSALCRGLLLAARSASASFLARSMRSRQARFSASVHARSCFACQVHVWPLRKSPTTPPSPSGKSLHQPASSPRLPFVGKRVNRPGSIRDGGSQPRRSAMNAGKSPWITPSAIGDAAKRGARRSGEARRCGRRPKPRRACRTPGLYSCRSSFSPPRPHRRSGGLSFWGTAVSVELGRRPDLGAGRRVHAASRERFGPPSREASHRSISATRITDRRPTLATRTRPARISS